MALKDEVKRLEELREEAKFSSGITVHMPPENRYCPECGGPMNIQQTTPRTIATLMFGVCRVIETILECKAGCKDSSGKILTQRSDALARIVPPGAVYGYDIEVFVGLSRYLDYRQRDEIREALEAQRIVLSTGTISNLTRRFIGHLEALHVTNSEGLKRALWNDGGFATNIDATGDSGRGMLLVVFSEGRDWILGAWRITTECIDQIEPCLDKMSEWFGCPISIMRDLGKAVTPAVESFCKKQKEKTGKEIKILSCHQHFVADVGTDLLEPLYGKLRNLFRKHGVAGALRTFARQLGKRTSVQTENTREKIKQWSETEPGRHALPAGTAGLATLRVNAQWILDHTVESKNNRFPFERPFMDFYKRCTTVRRALDAYLMSPPDDTVVLRSLKRLATIIDPIVSDLQFRILAKPLQERIFLLDDLRSALRLNPRMSTPSKKREIVPPERMISELNDIKKSVEAYKKSLHKHRLGRKPGQNLQESIDLIIEHLDRHDDTLWGHIIKLSDGRVRVLNRTNIPCESNFNVMKHNERRRSGRKNLGQDLENMQPAAALTRNLKKDDYVQIVCGGDLKHLPKAIAELDFKKRKGLLCTDAKMSTSDEHELETASLSTPDKKFVRNDFIEKTILAAASSRAPRIAPSQFQQIQ